MLQDITLLEALCCTSLLYCCSCSLLAQDITLSEALCGTAFYVQHLDGRVLEVVTQAGEVIKPDSWKCINEEGMPVHGRPFEKGNLYIRFAVKFPDSLSSEEVQQLKQVLPPPPQPQPPMSEDEPEQVSQAVLVHLNKLVAGKRGLQQHFQLVSPLAVMFTTTVSLICCRRVWLKACESDVSFYGWSAAVM